MIELQQKKNFIWLRIISIFVIIAFVTTQFDLSLAFANTAAPIPTPEVTKIKDDSNQELLGDIRYSQSYEEKRDQLRSEREVGQTDLVESPAAPVSELTKFTDFIKADQPLTGSKAEMNCETAGSIETCTMPNAENLDCLAENAQCAYYKVDTGQNNRIVEIGDFTDLDHKDELEVRQFSYDQERARVEVTTRSAGDEKLDTVQVYELEPVTNSPERLIESGILVQDENERESVLVLRSYNWDQLEVSVYDPVTGATGTWELVNGEPGRVLSYKGLYDDDSDPDTSAIKVDVEYQYEGDKVTYFDYESNTFVMQNTNGMWGLCSVSKNKC